MGWSSWFQYHATHRLHLGLERWPILLRGDDGVAQLLLVVGEQVQQHRQLEAERILQFIDALLEGTLEVTAAAGQVFLFIEEAADGLTNEVIRRW